MSSRLREASDLLKVLVRYEPRSFAIAVCGAAVYAICTVASSFAVGWTIDNVIIAYFDAGSLDTSRYVIGGSLIVGIGLTRAVGVVIRRSFAGVTEWNVAAKLSQAVASKVMRQPAQWHGRQMTGDLVSRVGVDVDATVGVLAPLPFSTSVLVLVVTSGIWLVVVDVPLGLVALLLIPCLLLLNVGYQKRIDVFYDRAQHELGELSEAVHESFEGVLVVKVFGAEDRETRRLSTISGRLRDARIRAVYARSTFEALLDFVPASFNVLLILIGAHRVSAGAMSLGELSSFIYLFTLLIFPLRIIGYVLSEVPHSASGWRRVASILDEPQEERREPSKVPSSESVLRLLSCSYSFPGSSVAAIESASLELKSGEILAIVGRTGSGKSTLLRLAGGLLSPSTGEVVWSKASPSFVFQEAFLLSGSITDNVALGESVDGDRLRDALITADALDFVEKLEDGLDTMVGERGVSLSGGQRQRIALARALYKNPTLILIDDTTSALDPTTEQNIIRRLKAREGMSSLIVASRPSTVAVSDRVAFIDLGAIRDVGTHEELLARSDEYRQLIESYESDRSTDE
jgi:ABC-type multidrug transport system fused ATPase/permease subunit